MSNTKIFDLTASGAIADGDTLAIIDVSDTAQSADGSTRKITKANLTTDLAPKASPTFTGTVTLPTGLTGVLRADSGVVAVDSNVPTLTSASTLTNKRITKRILSATSYTTDTGTSLNCDTLDEFIVTAQAGALKLNNPTGTPTDGQVLFVAVTGTAARALTYDTQFEASTVSLPTTTVTTARLNMLFIWRADTSKWVILATA